ncbi:MAG: succinylglutamate desuccinylase/aspartoacylase family protein [Steroidobacteraceae bacterium]
MAFNGDAPIRAAASAGRESAGAGRAGDSLPVRCHHAAMFASRAFATAVLLSTALPSAGRAADVAIELPAGIATHADGRAPIESLYRSWLGLIDQGWQAESIVQSAPEGTSASLPIIALRSPKSGPALWILAGIHGEEPAGPNAVAAAIDEIARLGAERPVVLLPLLNPHGYARNWRYLNAAVYSESVDGQSVGDSSHLLPSAEDPSRPRAAAASSAEADAITAFILARAKDYPPIYSIDLHEDNLIDEGYVYSQGMRGENDPLAIGAVEVLKENGVPIKLSGKTRFDEPIAGGIIGPVVDSSIDELMSADRVLAGGCQRPGPAARTVLVFETPAAALPLERRIAAHAALIRRLTALIEASKRPP